MKSLYELRRFLKAKSDDSVSEAAAIAGRFVAAKKGHENAGTQEAIRAVAREAGLRTVVIEGLTQPSRRPKRIDLFAWRRLCAAYLRFLNNRLIELENEIKRVEALVDPADGAAQDLLRKAEDLLSHIREVAGR